MKRNSKDSDVFPFHVYLETALVAGARGVVASPASFGTRATSEADSWAHFRIRKLAFRLHPTFAAATGTQAVGWLGGVQDTNPTTVSQINELIPSVPLSIRATVPTEWVRVSASDLAGPFPWYKSVAGTADATEESPGTIMLAGVSTDVTLLEIRGLLEFKVAVAPANTPEQLKLREKARLLRKQEILGQERSRLLGVLSAGTAAPSITPLGT